MSTNNICFHGEIKKILILLVEKSILSGVTGLVYTCYTNVPT